MPTRWNVNLGNTDNWQFPVAPCPASISMNCDTIGHTAPHNPPAAIYIDQHHNYMVFGEHLYRFMESSPPLPLPLYTSLLSDVYLMYVGTRPGRNSMLTRNKIKSKSKCKKKKLDKWESCSVVGKLLPVDNFPFTVELESTPLDSGANISIYGLKLHCKCYQIDLQHSFL